MKTNTPYSRKKKKRALNKKKSISFTKRKSALLLFMRYMLPKSPISSPTVFVSSFRYRNALGFPVIMYQALEIHIKQFHGQLFSNSDEVAISVQCTLVYNNLVKPLGICNRTGSKSKNKNPLSERELA